MNNIPIAIIGLGKIAVDQHIPAIRESSRFDLAAIVTRDGRSGDVPSFKTVEEMLREHPEVEAVSLCVPPGPRYDLARAAIEAGKHVLLEKPPATSVAAAQSLVQLAADSNVTLFAAWHSRYAAGVEPARRFLQGQKIRTVEVFWKENVRVWHPGQDWIWSPGNLGVFDPGINAISILTTILPDALFVKDAVLKIPENTATPIAATITLGTTGGYDTSVDLDWRETGKEKWDIRIKTSDANCSLTDGGARLEINGRPVEIENRGEYPKLYEEFAGLIERRKSLVDLAPLQHVADAFMLGRYQKVEAFSWETDSAEGNS